MPARPANFAEHEFEEVGAERLHAILNPYVEQRLNSQGFENVKPLTWVGPAEESFRPILKWEKSPMQGLMPRWGWSIDFVPHVGTKRIGWHRSAKHARLDSGHWNNFSPEWWRSLPYLYGESGFGQECAGSDTIGRSLDDAFAFWCDYRGTEGVFELTKLLRKRGFSVVSPTHPLPDAFCLATLGELEKAHALIRDETEELLRHHKPYDRQQILIELHQALDRTAAE